MPAPVRVAWLPAPPATLTTTGRTSATTPPWDSPQAAHWELVAESAALPAAAEGVLPAGRIQDLHAEPVQRMAELVHRGQDQGVFRTDLPTTWLVSLTHHILHGAANEVRQGRLARHDAADAVAKSVRSALAA